MVNENEAGLRLAYVAASVALAAAGIGIATTGGQATEPTRGARGNDVTASITTRVESAMLAAQVVSSGDSYSTRLARGSAAIAADPTAAPAPGSGAPVDADEAKTPEVDPPSDELNDAESEHPVAPPVAPPRPTEGSRSGAKGQQGQAAPPIVALRDRMSPANELARQIAMEESANEAQRTYSASAARWAPGVTGNSTEEAAPTAAPQPQRFGTNDELTENPGDAPRKLVDQGDATEEEPTGPRAFGSDAMDKEDRHLLFVWDSSIVRDEARSAELLAFASHRGYDTLAVEATGVGYHDAALTDSFARFTVEAADAGMETFALIGYPWFTVAAGAGLPGQPTSSVEGLAVLDVIASTGLFDGVVDDSHPYGVVYEVGGESRNWLFDEPAAASLDLQAWLRSAKNAIGDLPLIKTTPFWYDSHPALQGMVNIEGEGFLTLGHLVATEVDAMAVLAYRDTLDGPNGLLELVAGEMSMGPSIITLETGPLGAHLDYLTFSEEGLIALEATTQEVVDNLTGEWAFAGVGVHHYEPVALMAAELAETQSFGFVSAKSATVKYGALIDAYDSSLGTYTDQMTYNSELDAMTGIGLGALVSNGDIKLKGGALMHGDARAGQLSKVSLGSGTKVTGRTLSVSTPVVIPEVHEADSSGGQQGTVRYNNTASITGARIFSRLTLNGYASITIIGPANIVVDDLRMADNSYIWVDNRNGPVSFTINDRLDLGAKTFIAPKSLQARDLTLKYAGTRTIDMGDGARLLADVIAPYATIELGDDSEIYGRATAESLKLNANSRLHLDIDLLR